MALDLFGSKTYATVLQILTLVQQQNLKLEQIMATQADFDAKLAELNTEVERVAALVASRENVDISGLDPVIAALQAIQ